MDSSDGVDRHLTGLHARHHPDSSTAPMDVLALFRDAVASVPAYRKFLRDRKIDAEAVTGIDQIPLTTKAGYHQRYPLPERCRDGRIAGGDIVSVSSGSSGTPTVWPRSTRDERTGHARMEQIFRDAFSAGERTTLAVVCFALGNWIGGMYVSSVCRQMAAEGYPITVAAAGNNLDEVFRVIDEIGGFYDQVVLLGYPPFVKGRRAAATPHRGARKGTGAPVLLRRNVSSLAAAGIRPVDVRSVASSSGCRRFADPARR